MKSRVLWNRLFALWTACGLLGAALAVFCSFKCPVLKPGERTFRFLNDDSLEQQARYDSYDRWEERLAVLARGSLVYGTLGVLVFFSRGCGVLVAAGVIVVCEFAWFDATWVPL